MRAHTLVRLLVMAAVAACARPGDAPAQIDSAASIFSGSREPAVRAAAEMIDAGRPWRATEILDSAYRGVARSPEVTLLSATAAAAWSGWQRVERDLSGASWLDSQFDGEGWELLARAELARGADSLASQHAARAISRARSDRDRGIREVLLARALDRQAIGDSAAAMYTRATRHLPAIADWLELRAAGATADAARRQRAYARVATEVARGRVAITEAQARERWRDYAGAARAYAELGDKAQSLRLTLLGTPDSSARARVRSQTLALLAESLPPADARIAITLVDSTFTPLSPTEEIVVARAAAAAGLLARAASGYARGEGTLDPPTRYAYASVLSRLGRDADAAVQFGRVPSTGHLGALAAYQRARSLLRAGRGADGRAALRRVAQTFARDTDAAAPALFLLADLATDDGRDADARAGFASVARRYPSSDLAAEALFRAAAIAYASGAFATAARELDVLVARYPRSVETTAARYWAGRALERSGDRKRASDRWREVMTTDPLSYYSIRSAGRLGVPAWKPAQTTDSIARTRGIELAVARTELLDAAGMSVEEGFEYDALASAPGTTPDSLLVAADALRRRGEISRSISLARRALAATPARDTRLFHLVYPVAYGDVIRAEAAANRVDPALAAALIHQESSFNPRATSRAGAVGLMQVLPGVGAEIAKAQRIAGYERVLLYQPDVNVRLGMAHLAAMLRQYPKIEYALAAYNAGGSPVQRWRRKAGTDDPELFIERIPYDETRDYVRILLRNRAMYEALYGW